MSYIYLSRGRKKSDCMNAATLKKEGYRFHHPLACRQSIRCANEKNKLWIKITSPFVSRLTSMGSSSPPPWQALPGAAKAEISTASFLRFLIFVGPRRSEHAGKAPLRQEFRKILICNP